MENYGNGRTDNNCLTEALTQYRNCKERNGIVKSRETKLKFIEMRAKGVSIDKIAAALNVAPRTLHRWKQKMLDEIATKALDNREQIIEKFNLAEGERLERYCTVYKRVSEQVAADCIDIIPTHQLLKMMLALDKKIAEASNQAIYGK
jgi:hypothetical protein